MPELTASLPIWIISQIFGVFSVTATVFGFQFKRKRNTLIAISIGNIFTVLATALLSNWVVVSLMTAACLRNLTFAYLEHRCEKGKTINARTSFALMILFMIFTIIPVTFFWEWWFDWVLLVSSLFIIFGIWMQGIHIHRIASIIYDTLIIVNYIEFFNIIGIIQAIIIQTSKAIFYVRFFREKKKKADQKPAF